MVRNSICSLLSATALISAVLSGGAIMSPAYAGAAEAVRRYDIPAGSLAHALSRFAEESGIQISYEAELTADRESPDLHGSFTNAEALSRLLAGSGLAARAVGENAVSIARTTTGRLDLDPMEIRGSVAVASAGRIRPEEDEARQSHAAPDAIIVTALRIETAISGLKTDVPLLETPQAIAVVNMEQARIRSILSVGDAVAYSAGIFANAKGVTYGGDAIAIRGFGNDGTTGAAINSYIDGLRLSGTGYVSGGLDPYLYERVEVVKGPASVLFGQSAPGGLINMVSKRPKEEFGGEILARYGSFGRKQAALDVTGPLTQDGALSARLSGAWFDTHDIYPYSERKRVLIAPSLAWKPGERTNLTILTHYQKDDFAGSTLNWLPTIGTLIANPNGRVRRELFTGDPNYQRWKRETMSAGYQFEHHFSDAVTLRQNFRYTHTKLDNRNIYIARLTADLRTATRQAFGLIEDADDLTVDTNIAFKFSTGPLSHKILVGLDWQKLKSGTIREFVTAPTLDIFAPVYNQTIPARNPFRNQRYRNDQTGVYAQDQIAFEGWRLLLGLRQDWASAYTFDTPSGASEDTSNKALTKRAALLYLFDNGLAPYASFSESFIPQYGSDFAGASFSPEKGRQFEVGLKFQPRGGDSFLTASLFDLRRRNFLTDDPDNAGFSRQTGEVRMRGVEVEANVKLGRSLTMIGAYTLLASRVTKSGDTVSGVNPATLLTEDRDQQGLQLVAVPRHNVSLWMDYASPLGLSLGGGVRYSSATYGDAANLSRVPAFALVDTSLRFDLGAWAAELKGVELSAKANNLFDKRYVASCSGVDRCYYGQARNVIVDLAWRW